MDTIDGAERLIYAADYPSWLPLSSFSDEYLQEGLAYWSDMLVADGQDGGAYFYPGLRSWVTGEIRFRGIDVAYQERSYPEPLERLVRLSQRTLANINEMPELKSADEALRALADCYYWQEECPTDVINKVAVAIANGTIFRLLCARVVSGLDSAAQDPYFAGRIFALSSAYFQYDVSGKMRISELVDSGLVQVMVRADGPSQVEASEGDDSKPNLGAGDKKLVVEFRSSIWEHAGLATFNSSTTICRVLERRLEPGHSTQISRVSGVLLRKEEPLHADSFATYHVETLYLERLPDFCN